MATGHFSGKKFGHWSLFGEKFSLLSTSGHTGSNDTGLKSISCPGTESIKGQGDKGQRLNLGYYNVLLVC